MANKYFLHRISHEGEVAYVLLKQGYLTLGWQPFADTDILGAAREEGYPRFDVITAEHNANHYRGRWGMWYFAQMDAGDIVVVPMYGGLFSVYAVVERAKPIWELETRVSNFTGMWNNHKIRWEEHRLYDENDKEIVDIGFFIEVKAIVENVPRGFVGGKFNSRMKIRTTCTEITDIRNEVDDGIKAGKENEPITLYGSVIDPLAVRMRESFISVLNPDKFELLIKWYLEKCGASSTRIPSKNEAGKSDGADADIIAEFDNLKYIVYVQAKWHDGTTSDWAVHQINRYKNQKSEGDPAYTYATWVVTSAEGFSPQAIAEADEKGVRLIDGTEFARMLLDIGLLDINEAFV